VKFIKTGEEQFLRSYHITLLSRTFLFLCDERTEPPLGVCMLARLLRFSIHREKVFEKGQHQKHLNYIGPLHSPVIRFGPNPLRMTHPILSLLRRPLPPPLSCSGPRPHQRTAARTGHEPAALGCLPSFDGDTQGENRCYCRGDGSGIGRNFRPWLGQGEGRVMIGSDAPMPGSCVWQPGARSSSRGWSLCWRWSYSSASVY
jgi:hypothetical protein